MARPPRFEYPGAVYHVMARGDGGKRIFLGKEDCESFLHRMERVCQSHGWRVHAWVLMGNHFHLLQALNLKFLLVLFLCPLSVMGSTPEPDEVKGTGLSVHLSVPFTTLLEGEVIQYEYVLNNASNYAVPVAIPDDALGNKTRHFGHPAGGQAFLEAKWASERPAVPFSPFDGGPLFVEKAQWPPKDVFGEEMRAWLSLPAGQRIVWNQSRLQDLYFGIGSGANLIGLQAHWLLGPKHWISSDVVPVRVINVSRSSWTELFEMKWSSYGLGKDEVSMAAFSIPIEEKTFLFVNGWNRVAEIGPQDQIKHQIDRHGTNMEVSITGSEGTRRLFFHLGLGLTRDTPWPIGPVDLHYPKPETIPPAELESLRQIEFSKSGDSSSALRPDKKPRPTVATRDVPDDKKQKLTKDRTWIVLFCMGSMALLLVLLILRQRLRHARGR